jgi:hypothetical protein
LHETLFDFPQAFILNQQWLKRHPEDHSALSDFAERHFTTGRFAEGEQRIAALLANPAVEPRVHTALQAIQIADLLALGKADLIPEKIEALIEGIAEQPAAFKVDWSFKGTRYFIGHDAALVPYRSWLLQLFDALEGADRQAILTALQAARASVPVVARP